MIVARVVFQILSAPDGSSDSLILKDSKMGDGTLQIDNMHEFDGSVLAYEFSIPPEQDAFYDEEDLMELTETQTWVLAKAVQRGFMEGRFQAAAEEEEEEEEPVNVMDKLKDRLGLNKRKKET